MAKFLQEYLAPQAQEIDQSNEFMNLRVSCEAQTERDEGGAVWELDQAGLGIAVLPGKTHTVFW